MYNTRFLGLDTHSSLSCKDHVDRLMSELGTACYAINYVKHFMSQDTQRTLYFSYFHPVLSYGIIFWGNSAYRLNISKIQKKVFTVSASNGGSCLQWFKKLEILPLKSHGIFSPLLFVAKNRDLDELNSEIRNINTRFSTATANLTTFQNGPFYFGIKVSSHLPTGITNTSHDVTWEGNSDLS